MEGGEEGQDGVVEVDHVWFLICVGRGESQHDFQILCDLSFIRLRLCSIRNDIISLYIYDMSERVQRRRLEERS